MKIGYFEIIDPQLKKMAFDHCFLYDAWKDFELEFDKLLGCKTKGNLLCMTSELVLSNVPEHLKSVFNRNFPIDFHDKIRMMADKDSQIYKDYIALCRKLNLHETFEYKKIFPTPEDIKAILWEEDKNMSKKIGIKGKINFEKHGNLVKKADKKDFKGFNEFYA